MPAETLCNAAGQPLSGPLLITPNVFGDDRGFFYESWNERRFRHDLISSGVPAGDAEAPSSGRTITHSPPAVYSAACISSSPRTPRANWSVAA